MDTYKTLNNIQTHLLKFGDPFNTQSNVILCVTGNPGLPGFYEEFAAALHEKTGLPVVVIGHAGHEEVPDKNSNRLAGQETLFNLSGQLHHKLDLINNELKQASGLHVIGHSVGAWMLLQILHEKQDVYSKVKSAHFLFPTLEHIGKSRNGFLLNTFLRPIHKIIMFLIKIIFMCPLALKVFFIQCYLMLSCLPDHYKDRILKYINPSVLEKVLFLAYDEMDTIKDLNYEAMNNIKHMTSVIYTRSDGWVPEQNIKNLEVFQPDLKIQHTDCSHAFVLKSSEKIAEMVSDFIKKHNEG